MDLEEGPKRMAAANGADEESATVELLLVVERQKAASLATLIELFCYY